MMSKTSDRMVWRTQAKSVAGVTLVELMVSLALGLLVTFIMGTMYLSSSASFSAATQVARIQENIRFSTFYLQQNLREASYSYCGDGAISNVHLDQNSVNYVANSGGNGIVGWEFNGTGEGDTLAVSYKEVAFDSPDAVVNAARTDNAASVADYTGFKLPSGGTVALPQVILDLEPVAGSDIVAVVIERATNERLATAVSKSIPAVTLFTSGAEVGLGSVVRLGDCNNSDKFQNVSNTPAVIESGNGAVAGFNPGNANTHSEGAGNHWAANHPVESRVSVDVLRVFYIGTGSSGLPALFRYESECGLTPPTETCATPISNLELIEGVENLQLFYGEDTTGDGVANIFRAADVVDDFRDVVSVRIGTLMRSTERAELIDSINYDLADGVTINPDDLNVIRYASNETVYLRNRGG